MTTTMKRVLVHRLDTVDAQGEIIMSSGVKIPVQPLPLTTLFGSYASNHVIGEANIYLGEARSGIHTHTYIMADLNIYNMTEELWIMQPCAFGHIIARNHSRDITQCTIDSIVLDRTCQPGTILSLKEQRPMGYLNWKKYGNADHGHTSECPMGGNHERVNMVYSAFCKKCNQDL